MTEVYRYTSYRDAVRAQVKAVRRERPGFTLKHLASRIALTPTYLSRVLNDPKAHLSPEHLERIGKLLGWNADELEYVQTLRTYASAQSPELKARLEARLEELRARGAVAPTVGEEESFWNALVVIARKSGIKSATELAGVLGVSRVRADSLWSRQCHLKRGALEARSTRELSLAVLAQQERFPEKPTHAAAWILALTPDEAHDVREILNQAHERITRIADQSIRQCGGSGARLLVTVSTQLHQWT